MIISVMVTSQDSVHNSATGEVGYKVTSISP